MPGIPAVGLGVDADEPVPLVEPGPGFGRELVDPRRDAVIEVQADTDKPSLLEFLELLDTGWISDVDECRGTDPVVGFVEQVFRDPTRRVRPVTDVVQGRAAPPGCTGCSLY